MRFALFHVGIRQADFYRARIGSSQFGLIEIHFSEFEIVSTEEDIGRLQNVLGRDRRGADASLRET